MALDPQVAKANLVVAYRALGTLQSAATTPTATNVRKAEGAVATALANFYEAAYTFVIEEHRPIVTP